MIKVLFLFPLLALFTGLYMLSQGKSAGYEDGIEEYDFKLPALAPIGFYLVEKIPYRFNSDYDRKVRAKIADLYGQRDVNLFFTVHNAQRLVVVVALLFLIALIGLLGDVDISFFIFGLIIAGVVYYLVDREVDKKLELKKRNILIDFPAFLNTLTLLINAGLPFTTAVQKIAGESDVRRPLYKELNITLAEIKGGKSISQAYEDFAVRCKVPEITRFVSMLLQNLNRGSTDLVYVLRMLAQECWGRRKDIARKQGEEAASKLILPMALVFVAVAIIVLAPAMMTMGM